MTISLCMIVKNEEAVLRRCLDSVCAIADEIVVVDTGSSDATKEIAAQYTSRIFDFVWRDDFSAARNYAFSKATKDYILWLDADDVLPAASAEGLAALKRSDASPPDVLMLPYQVSFAEDGACGLWYYRERLFRRTRGFLWVGAVHEVIVPSGEIRYLDFPVEHRPGVKPASDRNLRIYRALLQKNGILSSRDRYYYARELYDHQETDSAAAQLLQYLDQPEGWVEDKKAACALLAACYQAAGDWQRQLHALLRALEYDAPGAGLCCALGQWYCARGFFQSAAFWFHAALRCEKPMHGFIYEDEYGFLPSIWLCVCYDRLGDLREARVWNDRAAALHPGHPSVLHNQSYLNGRLDGQPE